MRWLTHFLGGKEYVYAGSRRWTPWLPSVYSRRMRFPAIRGIAVLCLMQAALFGQTIFLSQSNPQPGRDSASAIGPLPSPEPDCLSVMAVGDVIPHLTVLNAAKDPISGAYDFRPSFRYVKGYIQDADLAICNVETVFTGDGTYTGYPDFDSPESLAASLRDTGFDVGITANNHMLDQGTRGFEGTIDALRRNGIVVAGSRKAGEPRYAMALARGRKVAVIAYSYAGYDAAGKLVVNTRPVTPEIAQRINYFTSRELASGLAQIRAAAEAARAAGAELIICYYHWGEEYAMAPDRVQIAIARASADMGADIVFGSHPHVVQKAETLKSGSGKDVPVFYSLGNFLSNQRLDTMDNRFAEDGMMAFASFSLPREGRVAGLLSASAVATWVDKRQDGTIAFEIIPIDGSYRQNATAVSRNLFPQLAVSLEATKAALGTVNFRETQMRFEFFPGALEKAP